ncbi:MAG: hypothetical protein HC915_02605 [Anaerolineae bacterium]|nr:hypothetical protein [Anaerolineae bacterium]
MSLSFLSALGVALLVGVNLAGLLVHDFFIWKKRLAGVGFRLGQQAMLLWIGLVALAQLVWPTLAPTTPDTALAGLLLGLEWTLGGLLVIGVGLLALSTQVAEGQQPNAGLGGLALPGAGLLALVYLASREPTIGYLTSFIAGWLASLGTLSLILRDLFVLRQRDPQPGLALGWVVGLGWTLGVSAFILLDDALILPENTDPITGFLAGSMLAMLGGGPLLLPFWIAALLLPRQGRYGANSWLSAYVLPLLALLVFSWRNGAASRRCGPFCSMPWMMRLASSRGLQTTLDRSRRLNYKNRWWRGRFSAPFRPPS